MKTVVFYPFFSQQNKCTGGFELASDSGVKLYSYIARRLHAEAGFRADIVLPHRSQWASEPPKSECGRAELPPGVCWDNLERRLQWDPVQLRRVCKDAHLLLTQHEFLAYPVRCLFPELKIGMEVGIRPETAWPQTAALFQLARDSADFVHCNSETLRQEVLHRHSSVWEFGYDDSVFTFHRREPSYDVVFPSRASATSYSNHELFLASLRPEWRVCMTDPTSYLRLHGTASDKVCKERLSVEQYNDVLARSSVAVSLTDNGYGGYALREAIAVGCVPVVPRLPEYVDLLSDKWPYFAEEMTPHGVQEAIGMALRHSWSGVHEQTAKYVHGRIRMASYSYAYSVALADIRGLLT